MQIIDICTRPPVTLNAQGSLQDAAILMRDQHVGLLVITGAINGSHQVLGVLTDRDMVIQALTEPDPSSLTTVGDLAHTDVAVVSDDATLDDALEAMGASGVRRVLVKDQQGQLKGVVSTDDLFEVLAEHLGMLTKVLRSGLAREVVATEASRSVFGTSPSFPVFGTSLWKGSSAG